MNPEGILKHSEASEKKYQQVWQEWVNLWESGKPTNEEIEQFCKKNEVEFTPPVYRAKIKNIRQVKLPERKIKYCPIWSLFYKKTISPQLKHCISGECGMYNLCNQGIHYVQ